MSDESIVTRVGVIWFKPLTCSVGVIWFKSFTLSDGSIRFKSLFFLSNHTTSNDSTTRVSVFHLEIGFVATEINYR